MAKATSHVPAGYHTVTPYLTLRDAAQAIDFYTRALGAEELMRMPGPGGKGVGHAEIKIGDSIVFLSDESLHGQTRAPASLGGATGYLFLYVPDVDAAFDRAVKAGAKVTMPLADMFWGDRFGTLVDPFGHHWGLATHQEDVPPAEIEKRMKVQMGG